MVLSGWTQTPPVDKDNKSNGNGASPSNALQSEPVKTNKDKEKVEVSEPSEKKRKRIEASEGNHEEIPINHQEVEKLDDDDDDVVMFNDWDSTMNKKKRLQ